MDRILGFVIFFSLALIVTFLFHYYIFLKLSSVIQVSKTILAIIIFILAASFPILSIIESIYANNFTRVLYFISSLWIGIAVLAFLGFLLMDIINIITKLFGYPLNQQIFGIIIIIAVIFASLIGIYNARATKITEISVEIKDLPKKLDGVRVVQISDVHLGSIYREEFLSKIIDITNSLNPNIVLITGDLFDGADGSTEKLALPLKKLKAEDIYFISGNHEIYLGEDKVLKAITQAGVKNLNNEIVDYNGLYIIGLRYPKNEINLKRTTLDELKEQVSKLDKKQPIIVISHAPVGLKEAEKMNVSLMLSGHTHNGQMFPFNLITWAVYGVKNGYTRIGEMHLYISDGVGTWGPPIRLASKSEIVLITLKSA